MDTRVVERAAPIRLSSPQKIYFYFKGVSRKDLSVIAVTSPPRPAEYLLIIKFGLRRARHMTEFSKSPAPIPLAVWCGSG
jgi:hypothetical protein